MSAADFKRLAEMLAQLPPEQANNIESSFQAAAASDPGALFAVAAEYQSSGRQLLANHFFAMARTAEASRRNGSRNRHHGWWELGGPDGSTATSESAQVVNGHALLHTLTRREREVVRHALGHVTSQEIADQLFLSRRTVESHLARSYDKLGVRNRRELRQLLGSTTGS